RSSQAILNAAQHVIENNEERLINNDALLRKDLYAANEEVRNSPVEPLVLEYPNIAQEEAGVIAKIMELQQKKVPLNEIAVIYYRHAQAENIIRILQRKNIPYKVIRRINILELPIIRNLLILLQYIQQESEKPFSGEHLLFEVL